MPIQRRGAISKNISIGLCRRMPTISGTLILLHSLTIVREWHFGKMPLLRAISCKQRDGAQQLVSYIGSLRPRAYAWRVYFARRRGKSQNRAETAILWW